MTYCMHGVHQILHPLAVCDGIQSGQEDRPRTAEDQEAHPCLFSEGPPFVFLFQVDIGIDAENQLGHGKGEDYGEEYTK